MRSTTGPGVLLLALSVSACTAPQRPDAATSACGDGPGRVTVGEGGSRLRPLPATGGELPIVLGAQGGIHVLVGFSVTGMDLTMGARYRLEDAETGEIVGNATEIALRPSLFSTELGQTVRNPDLLVLDPEAPSVDRFAGRVARLYLEAINAESHACDVREVTLAATPP
ncbi:MAG: hypothetical protein DRJ42_23580 [Deltaproteobacteria bacterium]|nr:MAG: hypothetical protein DRJ42_23580 [Deltaproteobacteria bacterium]